MPTILRWNGYRFYFFSNEGTEPPHVHVDKAGCSVKVWLDPVAISRNMGYSDRELAEILRKVEEHAPDFKAAWHGYFGN